MWVWNLCSITAFLNRRVRSDQRKGRGRFEACLKRLNSFSGLNNWNHWNLPNLMRTNKSLLLFRFLNCSSWIFFFFFVKNTGRGIVLVEKRCSRTNLWSEITTTKTDKSFRSTNGLKSLIFQHLHFKLFLYNKLWTNLSCFIIVRYLVFLQNRFLEKTFNSTLFKSQSECINTTRRWNIVRKII